MNDDTLTMIIEKHCVKLMDMDTSFISAGDVALSAYEEMDPEQVSPLLVRASCRNDLRRRAEAALRRIHAEEERKIEDIQTDAFSEILRDYYPVERAGLHGYVPREEMTHDEVSIYVSKLRKEASAKEKHADALEAWDANRNSSPRMM